METLRWLFLESTAAIVIVAGVSTFVGLVMWRRGESPRPLLVCLSVGLAWGLTSYLVVTPRERADDLMRRIEDDVRISRVGALSELLARDFRAGSMDRRAFLEFARETLDRVRVVQLYRSRLDICNEREGEFTAGLSYVGQIQFRNDAGGMKSRWNVRIGRTPDGWRVLGIEPESLNERPVKSWDDISP